MRSFVQNLSHDPALENKILNFTKSLNHTMLNLDLILVISFLVIQIKVRDHHICIDIVTGSHHTKQMVYS